MTLTVTVDAITADATAHTACRYPATGVGTGLWAVSWLPGWILTRDEAATAMRIAVFTASVGDDFTGCLTQLATWAFELGLDAEQAWNLTTRLPAAAAAA